MNIFAGIFLGCGIAYLSYRSNALSESGGLAAAIFGTIVFGLGGVGWAVVLLTFFISSSALSKLFSKHKQAVGQDFAKGSRRDASQVAANGGVAGVFVLIYFFRFQVNPASSMLPLLWMGFAASLAAANADTWGTELGVLNPRPPVLVTSFLHVPKGTSGAVSLVGTLAALAGSALVAGTAVISGLVGWAPTVGLPLWVQFILITGVGLLGALVDSVLGATIQAVYTCPVCSKETEHHPRHTCGTPTIHKRGLIWLNNDWVNTACTLSGGLIGWVLSAVLG